MSNEESIEGPEVTYPAQRDVELLASRVMRHELAMLRVKKCLRAYRALEKLGDMVGDLNDQEIYRPDQISQFMAPLRTLESMLRKTIRDNEDEEVPA